MKHKKLFCLSLAAVMAFSVAALAACGGDEEPAGPQEIGSLVPTEAYKMPDKYGAESQSKSATRIAVHDPSVFYDKKSDTYYAFGSHYAVASSSDLIEWKQEVADGQDEKLFGEGGAKAAMPETMRRANNQDDVWAPDVEYYNGKYYMYVAFTQQMYTSKSVISRVESDNVLGPYGNETILLESISADAEASGSNKPNCIDAELFYDKEGKLWMVYGSFFGGIYIKELYNSGEKWGLPKEDGLNDWGKRIWLGGYSEGVEGPYIFYNPLTEYYYLMTSEANLFENYNMRIARSENPDGPYVDIAGNDVATSAGKGNKVAGNYKFAEANTQPAYAAMGHNSVVQNPKTGEWFVVYHARRQTGTTVTTGHNLRVSQLFFNEDKWPVMSPVFYVGEKFGLIEQEDAAGDYDIIVHTTESSTTVANSVKYTLSEDGKVKQGTEEKGTWSIKDKFYVTITLSGSEYKGVIVPGWDVYTPNLNNQKPVFAITAISTNQGVSLWGISPREA